jgi:hypothetical protein
LLSPDTVLSKGFRARLLKQAVSLQFKTGRRKVTRWRVKQFAVWHNSIYCHLPANCWSAWIFFLSWGVLNTCMFFLFNSINYAIYPSDMDNKYIFCLIYNKGKIYITWWAYSNEYIH